ncbi:hypothetical protein AAFF_G00243940 [Aldrovandia affinis]|uniref:Uncharacterized protein n=1 Tax=Aldrovandia affinis TaxID=143900 RepID=A0AAD7RDL1_9TELE|nr:hypothetical protein AAFF_G00243940 [Aldrovandia affinis]
MARRPKSEKAEDILLEVSGRLEEIILPYLESQSPVCAEQWSGGLRGSKRGGPPDRRWLGKACHGRPRRTSETAPERARGGRRNHLQFVTVGGRGPYASALPCPALRQHATSPLEIRPRTRPLLPPVRP